MTELVPLLDMSYVVTYISFSEWFSIAEHTDCPLQPLVEHSTDSWRKEARGWLGEKCVGSLSVRAWSSLVERFSDSWYTETWGPAVELSGSSQSEGILTSVISTGSCPWGT